MKPGRPSTWSLDPMLLRVKALIVCILVLILLLALVIINFSVSECGKHQPLRTKSSRG